MADHDEESRRNAERMGRGVYDGMNAGVSRNAHTQGESREASEEQRLRRESEAERDRMGTGGYGDSSGYAEGTHAPLDAGDTTARSRPEGVGHQAESGMETDPYEGMRGADEEEDRSTR